MMNMVGIFSNKIMYILVLRALQLFLLKHVRTVKWYNVYRFITFSL